MKTRGKLGTFVVTKRVGTDDFAFYKRGDVVRGIVDDTVVPPLLLVKAHVKVKGEARITKESQTYICTGYFKAQPEAR